MRSRTPWPSPGNEEQVRLHNARVAISRAEDELAAFKDAKWLDDVRGSLDVANDILRGAFDKAAPVVVGGES